ncbi:MAG: DUF2796 domain-containing protein [Limnohabitans sp.]|nr:DUF2796 domain-containing protein [Limnohabitans sp.]
MKIIKILCILFAGCCLVVGAFAQHAHGNGKLQLKLQGQSLIGEMEMPMEALLGFEHLPKNKAQSEAMSRLQNATKDATYFIELPADAKCQQKEAKAESSMFQGVASKGHSDLDYSFYFICLNPQALTKISFPFFKSHIKSHQLKVEWVGDKGQKSFTVRSSKPYFSP